MKNILFFFSAFLLFNFSVSAQQNQAQQLEALTKDERRALKNIRATLNENRKNAALLKAKHSTLTQDKTDYFIQLVRAEYPNLTAEQLEILEKSVGRNFIRIEHMEGVVTKHDADFTVVRSINEPPRIVERLIATYTNFNTKVPRVGALFYQNAFQGDQAAAAAFRDQLNTWMEATLNQFGG